MSHFRDRHESAPVAGRNSSLATVGCSGGAEEFRTASHNVVADRLRGADGRVVEHKDDRYSGRGREAGAGRFVLDVLRAKDALDVVVVVTRWFGGVKLGGDRFRHFAAATAQAIDAARAMGC